MTSSAPVIDSGAPEHNPGVGHRRLTGGSPGNRRPLDEWAGPGAYAQDAHDTPPERSHHAPRTLTPRARDPGPAPPIRLGTAMTGYVLHHERAGSADEPGLLMVGSLGTTLAMWDPVLEGLSPDRAIVRVDVRGHGRSPVPDGPYSIAELGMDVVATLDELGLQQVSVCGLSIGGMIAMWVAANAPERIDRVVLICTSAHMPAAADAYRERARVVRASGSTESVADAVLARWFDGALGATACGHRRGVPSGARRDPGGGLRRMLRGARGA